MSEPYDVGLTAGGYDFTVRVYPAADPSGGVLVWAHGGAFMGGSLDMPEADHVSRGIAAAGVGVVSVGYTLAPADMLLALPDEQRGPNVPSRAQIEAEIAASGPRARFPVASLQVLAAYDWAVDFALRQAQGASTSQPQSATRPEPVEGPSGNVSIGGASAGGNLAAGVAVRLRDRGDRPHALLLCYPVLHAQTGVDRINLNYVGDPDLLADPYAFPGGHDLSGLAPTVLVTAEDDELRPSGDRFVAELISYGVPTEAVCETGSTHGFLNQPGDPAADATIARFAEAAQIPSER